MMTPNPLEWLRNSALPLWTSVGLHPHNGFQEALELNGTPKNTAQRCMVQARQIYAVKTALDMKLISSEQAKQWIQRGVDFILSAYSLPSGEFRKFPNVPGGHASNNPSDLYTQAFAIFGLAHSYDVLKNKDYKKRAMQTVSYLKAERSLPDGGFSELGPDGILYQSNPHMHLFEAFIAWMQVDDDPQWRRLAQEILDLCLTRFIDPRSGLLAEHFGPGWKPVLENGRFVVEPGHQYEWAWLMHQYRTHTKVVLPDHVEGLVMSSENFGISPTTGAVYDEIWSDLSVKTPTHRFWPQCERIKACSAMGLPASASEAMTVLMQFFVTPTQGLWFDRMNPDGSFHQEPARASSLYHIIGAISEFHRKRV